jgi:HEPN domain-containing protein
MPVARSIQSATQAEFQQLARMRLAEAKVLLAAGSWAGAYYLCGYTIEFALKSIIIKHLLGLQRYPDSNFKAGDFYTHDLQSLLHQADMQAVLLADPTIRPIWDDVSQWNEQSRYEVSITRSQVESLLKAVEEVLKCLEQHW